VLRFVSIIALSAALGSLIATSLTLFTIEEGADLADAITFVISFSFATMLFTLPGALMLAGAQALLKDIRLSPLVEGTWLLLIGVGAGGLILAPLGDRGPGLGAFYGACTAAMFLFLSWATRRGAARS